MLRKRHNEKKLDLLAKWTRPGDRVLDIGSGRGGDIHKWRKLGLDVCGIEPDMKLLSDAIRRDKEGDVRWWYGDSRDVPYGNGHWDVVSYMFSIHYTLLDEPKAQLKAAMSHLRPGGYLIGCVPDGDAILNRKEYSCNEGGFRVSRDGQTAVWTVDGPFYSGREVEEPIMTKAMLENLLGPDAKCLMWEPLGHGLSRFYSSFAYSVTSSV